MSEVISTSVPVVSAPLESSVSVSLLETDDISLNMCNLTKKDGNLESYIAHRLEGCGNVDLVSMGFKAVCPSSGDYIRIGTAEVGSSASVFSLAGRSNGFIFKANDKTKGLEIERILKTASTVSRQIRPASTNLPMIRLAYEKSAGTQLFLHIKIKVNGVRTHNDVFGAGDVIEGAGVEECEASAQQ